MPTAYITVPPDAAEELATALVEERLVACLNRIAGPVRTYSSNPVAHVRSATARFFPWPRRNGQDTGCCIHTYDCRRTRRAGYLY